MVCTLVSYVPKCIKAVILVSTLHHTNTISTVLKHAHKPEIVLFYNKAKGSVDVNIIVNKIYSAFILKYRNALIKKPGVNLVNDFDRKRKLLFKHFCFNYFPYSIFKSSYLIQFWYNAQVTSQSQSWEQDLLQRVVTKALQ